jgi:hypothetical protein
MVLKWEGSIRKWQAGIALPRRDNRKARKSQANADASRPTLEVAIHRSL